MELADNVNLPEAVSHILCEFLEVAFHMILYVRELYPPVVFQRRRKYNVPVQMSGHPELNQYIKDILVGMRPLIEKQAVEKVVLAVEDKDHHPMERFVFNIQCLNEQALRDDGYLLQLEDDLRALLLKINVCDALLQPNPPDCTFSVLVHTTPSAAASMAHHEQVKEFPWISAEPSQQATVPDTRVVPLKSVSSSILQMNLFVEETPNKTDNSTARR